MKNLLLLLLLDDRIEEMPHMDFEEYERKAYPSLVEQWIPPFKLPEKPFNKPPLSKMPYYPLSKWTLEWRKERWAKEDALIMGVPQFYMTPFITREHKEVNKSDIMYVLDEE